MLFIVIWHAIVHGIAISKSVDLKNLSYTDGDFLRFSNNFDAINKLFLLHLSCQFSIQNE